MTKIKKCQRNSYKDKDGNELTLIPKEEEARFVKGKVQMKRGKVVPMKRVYDIKYKGEILAKRVDKEDITWKLKKLGFDIVKSF